MIRLHRTAPFRLALLPTLLPNTVVGSAYSAAMTSPVREPSGNLSDFLLACIAEDEAAAQMPRGDNWHAEGESWRLDESRPVLVGGGKILASFPGDEEPGALAYMVRWQPAHVLAVCAAHRRIVELHWPDHECTDGSSNYPGVFAGDPALGMTTCPTLRALATAYADRDGWREEWAL